MNESNNIKDFNVVKSLINIINNLKANSTWDILEDHTKFNIIKEFIIACFGDELNPGVFMEVFCMLNYSFFNGNKLTIQEKQSEKPEDRVYIISNDIMEITLSSTLKIRVNDVCVSFDLNDNYIQIISSISSDSDIVIIRFDNSGVRNYIHAYSPSKYSCIFGREDLDAYEIEYLSDKEDSFLLHKYSDLVDADYSLMQLPEKVNIPDFNRKEIIEKHFPDIKSAIESINTSRQ